MGGSNVNTAILSTRSKKKIVVTFHDTVIYSVNNTTYVGNQY